MSGGFKDLFSGHAALYARARPTYPSALFDWLASVAPARAAALDCGAGNGQAAVELAGRFAKVWAVDPSAAQIANAAAHPRVEYRVAPAEATGLAAASVDLVTAAQAVHWFDHARFAAECRRVLRPGGVVAVWCYGVNRINPAVDAVTRVLYEEYTAPYWAPERRFIDEALETLPFPFAPLAAPAFAMVMQWTLAQYAAYLQSWSATQNYKKETGRDPVEEVFADLLAAWGEAGTTREVSFPLYLRAGRVDPRRGCS